MNNTLIKLLFKLKQLHRVNVMGKLSLNHKNFNIPVYGSIGYPNLAMSEPWMIDILKIVLPIERSQFVDVGVNVGQTLLKLRCIDTDIPYVGFEPNPTCVHYVQKLIEANGIKDSRLIPVGVNNKTELGQLHFFSKGSTDSSASMIEGFRPESTVDHVEYIPLFDIQALKTVLDINALSILKIDVEGGELEVLRSFADLLSQYNPIILMEILPAYSDQYPERIERQQEIEGILKERSYHLYRVIKENEELITLTEIEEIGIHSDLNACEYVFIPQSKNNKFQSALQNRSR